MKTHIKDDGTLVIIAESVLEAYFLRQVTTDEVVIDGNWPPVGEE